MKKIISVIISVIMLVGMLPVVAFAAEEITMISAQLRENAIPVPGDEVVAMSYGFLTAGSNQYEVSIGKGYWYDEAGNSINESYYGTGYKFEMGKTYYFETTVTAVSGYKFADARNIRIVSLTNDFNMFLYDYIGGEVLTVTNDNSEANLRYTFKMAKTPLKTIDKVVLEGIGDIAEDSTYSVSMGYHKCSVTNQKWTGSFNNGKFILGQRYTLTVTLTADSGYTFADGVDVDLITRVISFLYEPASVSTSNNNTVLKVVYEFEATGKQDVNSTTVKIPYYMTFSPVAGDYISTVPGEWFAVDEEDVYELVDEYSDTYYWYDENGYRLEGKSFEAGKTYYIEIGFQIKEEYRSSYQFGETVAGNIAGDSFSDDELDTTVSRYNGSKYEIDIRYYFTAQFPEGAGSSVNNPVVCSSFAEFKYAMENEDIRYIKLGSMDETIPKTEGEGLIPAIAVNGIKHLTLLGDSTFAAPAGDGIKTVCALLHLVQNDTLTITGSGTLKFRAVASSSYNAVIYNQGGSVNINDGKLIGSYNTAVYGKAIWQDDGELRISGGKLFAENALAPGKLSVPTTAVNINGGQAWIQGGTFRTENIIDTIDPPYGLEIGQYATVDLSGGTFYGILLPTDSTPLADYTDEDFYTLYSDGSWFNPESVWSQEYVESGKEVKIAHVINDVNVLINDPVPGRALYTKVYNVPEGSYLHTVDWYEDGEYISTEENFEAGKSYKVEICLLAEDNAEFASAMTSATINYDNSTEYQFLSNKRNAICLQLDLGVCPNLVNEVDLIITAPKEGEKPSYTVGCGSDAYYAVGGSSNYKDYRKWYMSSDNDDWWEINEKHAFMSGYYYKVYVDIKTANGYEFPLDGNLDPAVQATVNGNTANAMVAYDQDQSTYITIEYNFGECNDSVIEEVKIAGVTEPVAGEYPTYSAAVVGSGYHIDTTKNSYEDIYWKNPPEKWYYIKNGIGWYDMTDGDWVYENEKFIPGHEYEVNVYLKTDDGYEFYHDKWYDMLISATINGNEAGFDNSGSSCAINQKITYTFSCKQQEVSTLMLYLDTPEAGKTPFDYKVESAYPELYAPDENYAFGGICWYDCEGTMLAEDEEFIQGMQYKVEIKIVPTKVGGVNMCKFADNVNVMLNGNALTEYGDWDAVYASNNVVYIYYTFRKAAQAPEIASDPIEIYRSGNSCIVKLNESEAGVTYIAAAYNGEFLVKGVILSLDEAVTLTGDTVKVFLWKKGKLEPVQEAIVSLNR